MVVNVDEVVSKIVDYRNQICTILLLFFCTTQKYLKPN